MARSIKRKNEDLICPLQRIQTWDAFLKYPVPQLSLEAPEKMLRERIDLLYYYHDMEGLLQRPIPDGRVEDIRAKAEELRDTTMRCFWSFFLQNSLPGIPPIADIVERVHVQLLARVAPCGRLMDTPPAALSPLKEWGFCVTAAPMRRWTAEDLRLSVRGAEMRLPLIDWTATPAKKRAWCEFLRCAQVCLARFCRGATWTETRHVLLGLVAIVFFRRKSEEIARISEQHVSGRELLRGIGQHPGGCEVGCHCPRARVRAAFERFLDAKNTSDVFWSKVLERFIALLLRPSDTMRLKHRIGHGDIIQSSPQENPYRNTLRAHRAPRSILRECYPESVGQYLFVSMFSKAHRRDKRTWALLPDVREALMQIFWEELFSADVRCKLAWLEECYVEDGDFLEMLDSARMKKVPFVARTTGGSEYVVCAFLDGKPPFWQWCHTFFDAAVMWAAFMWDVAARTVSGTAFIGEHEVAQVLGDFIDAREI